MNLSLAGAGTLQMCFQMAASVSQLGFGFIADRWRPRVLLLTGPFIGVAVLSLIGLSTSAWMLGAVLIFGGLGGAAFHPPAAALVHRFSGQQRGLAMAFHITSGNIGQAVAPLLFAPYVQRFGLSATPWLMLPAIALLGGVLLRKLPAFERLQDTTETRGLSALRPYAQPLTLLYLIVVMRTLTALSFSTFVPVMLTRRGLSVGQAGMVASVFLAAVGTGGFLGGPVADRWGARRVIMLSLVSAVPFLATAPFLSGGPFVVVLAIGGLLLQSTLPVNVTFGQMIAPVSAATVSSLMMGFAWGMGGLMAPFVGMAADRIGIERTLAIMAFLPLAAAGLAMPLPAATRDERGRHHAVGRASDVATAETSGTDVAQ
jgi:FSR family fosmidomycin resistance protein-like MFS transporter